MRNGWLGVTGSPKEVGLMERKKESENSLEFCGSALNKSMVSPLVGIEGMSIGQWIIGNGHWSTGPVP